MVRLRQLPSCWAALAALALGLLLLAPPISQWRQARAEATALQDQALCTSGGLRLAALAGAVSAAHGGHHDDAGLAHAPACDYCLLAARLLPWVALLLALLPWCCPSAPRAALRSRVVTAIARRAHPPRGPPLFS
ncbi:DUF2946 family protein [Xanthomonas sacchari]|uniref:DUF2946 domain-containing protein n=1 Tax=Xanthomonas sacchari TaxID=56458 RepID=A0A2P5Z097_9XANT|nr:DUF2946 family protein [Xanthomonas sacchari]MDV0440314.1 DUF2946 family protein [Xanthomonas sacchari]PPU80695.1 DUF2946 domain-containing protein [Xanthomonas sacchari]